MQNNNVTLSVIINGQSGNFDAKEYVSPQDRQTYIEGREGSNFSLRLYNGNAFRVLAIPSVDGLSVLDGEEAGEHSPGFILEARQTLDIPGWMVDSSTAAKFFFAGIKAGSDQSYVAQMDKDTSNKGVIGLMVFREKNSFNYERPRGITSMRKGMAPSGGLRGWSSEPFYGSTMNASSMTGGMLSSCDAVFAAAAAAPSIETDMDAAASAALGTGFGEATDFSTTVSNFNRGDLLAVIVVYYADARGLKKKGIDVNARASTMPKPFPAMKSGCKTPNNWGK